MMNDKTEEVKIKLPNVRMGFPNLFKREVFEGKTGKYSATFLIPKEEEKLYEELQEAIEQAIRDANIRVPRDRWCIKDGDDRPEYGHEGSWTLKASSNDRPVVVDQRKQPLMEEDEVMYSGCYVNALVSFWIQNNKFGKRVNANLHAVQFAGHGDPFGRAPVDLDKYFDEVQVQDEVEFGETSTGEFGDDDIPF